MKKKHRRKPQSRTPQKGVLERRYSLYFRPNPSDWSTEDDEFSLEQPSPVKRVETEVTYGIPDSMFA